MKKNMLLTHSFLVLPLISSSFSWGMENSQEQQKVNQNQVNFKNMLKELVGTFENTNTEFFESELNQNNTTTSNANPPSIYSEVIDLPFSNTTNNKQQTTSVRAPQDLSASVILPTTKKQLTLLERTSRYLTTNYQDMGYVITELEKATFNAGDLREVNRFRQAIDTAFYYNETKSIEKIITLAGKNYPDNIRINNDHATKIHDFLKQNHTTQLELLKKELHNNTDGKKQQWNNATLTLKTAINIALENYKKQTENIDTDYNKSTEAYQEFNKQFENNIAALKVLNSRIREQDNNLLESNEEKALIPNKLRITQKLADQQIELIKKAVNSIPTVSTSTKPAQILNK